MTCETSIVYNGVTLYNVLTEGIDCTVERDSTGTDPIGLRVTVSVIAMVHTSPLTAHGVSALSWGSSSSISPGIRFIIERVSLPRKRFTMSIGGSIIYDIFPTGTEGPACNSTPPAIGFYTDIDNGPWADVKVLAIHGQTTAKCRFTFRFMTRICENPYNLRDVVNLRYWIAENIDCSSWLTTRRYQGTFRVSGRHEGLVANPHMLARQLTLPPLQPGFRRASIEWAEDRNPLLFHFTVTDVEQWAQAPSPATDWDGTYSVSIPQGEICADAELNFRVRGDKDVDKRHLLQLVQRIIDAKLHYQELITDTSCLLMSQVWHESLRDNEVGANLRIRYVGPEWVATNLPERNTSVGPSFDLGLPLSPDVSDWADNPRKKKYDKEVSTNPGLPTATTVGLFLCALQTPCCVQSLNYPPTKYEPEPTQVETSQPQEPSGASGLPGSSTRYTPDHLRSPYMWYKITNRYTEDTGWRAFPLGKQCSPSGSEDTVAFSHIHCPTSIREVSISACRVDEWPQMPKRQHWKDDQTGVKFILKHSKLLPSAVQLTADGKHEIRQVDMTLWYYMSRPYTQEEAILVGNAASIIPLLGGDSLAIQAASFADPVQNLGAPSS